MDAAQILRYAVGLLPRFPVAQSCNSDWLFKAQPVPATNQEVTQPQVTWDDLVLPSGGGTIEIDHVVVSKFGIFVIESLQARGRVSGTEVQDRWKESSLGRTRRFDNPVYRNRLQAQALSKLLEMPPRVPLHGRDLRSQRIQG